MGLSQLPSLLSSGMWWGHEKTGVEVERVSTGSPWYPPPPSAKCSSGPGLAAHLLCDFGQVVCPLWVSVSLFVERGSWGRCTVSASQTLLYSTHPEIELSGF